MTTSQAIKTVSVIGGRRIVVGGCCAVVCRLITAIPNTASVTTMTTAGLIACARVKPSASGRSVHSQIAATIATYALIAVPTAARTTICKGRRARITQIAHSISFPSCVFEEKPHTILYARVSFFVTSFHDLKTQYENIKL